MWVRHLVGNDRADGGFEPSTKKMGAVGVTILLLTMPTILLYQGYVNGAQWVSLYQIIGPTMITAYVGGLAVSMIKERMNGGNNEPKDDFSFDTDLHPD